MNQYILGKVSKLNKSVKLWYFAILPMTHLPPSPGVWSPHPLMCGPPPSPDVCFPTPIPWCGVPGLFVYYWLLLLTY